MSQDILLYNSLTRKKELFQPLHPPFIGIYVCGPTVYGPPHLGHARPYVVFDVVIRYFEHCGFKVRYVRNITDVGHLEGDCDEGEDKILKRARMEQVEPMEVVQRYTREFHAAMDSLNVRSPSIEPLASGHIIEQIEMIKKIMSAGLAYETNGSVYFDVPGYAKNHSYGKLSGRVLDELLTYTRELEGKEEKRNAVDFALWKKADQRHLMRWPSPWGDGFPGWHLECSVMSSKYLGEPFDIHGGGIDLQFPHHECEIAQSVAASGKEPVRCWMHNNLITINGRKMAKSLNNFITIEQLFTGTHPLLKRSYSPMTIRFFILQAHYRSTLDFSNEALEAAEKGLQKIMASVKNLLLLKAGAATSSDVKSLRKKCYDALNDDFNSAVVIAHLFEAARISNAAYAGHETVSAEDLEELKSVMNLFTFDILGLKDENFAQGGKSVEQLMEIIITIRNRARKNKDFATSDAVRDELKKINIQLKDEKDGTTRWEMG
ncbi:MAG: cysteine--tRNA ligase [Bacteroidetes bacterium]|nr:cysteine--tRNA ligase [Bacteroidota bacterium]